MYYFFQGSRLNQGARPEDYLISVGDDRCSVTEMTYNSLICNAPKSKPSGIEINGAMRVKVSQIFPKHFWNVQSKSQGNHRQGML